MVKFWIIGKGEIWRCLERVQRPGPWNYLNGAQRGVKKVGEKNEGGREEEEAALNCWYNKR